MELIVTEIGKDLKMGRFLKEKQIFSFGHFNFETSIRHISDDVEPVRTNTHTHPPHTHAHTYTRFQWRNSNYSDGYKIGSGQY